MADGPLTNFANLRVRTDANGYLIVSVSGSVGLTTSTFATLPSSPVAGQMAYITDSNSVVFHATAAGGGASSVLVVFDGSVWRVGG
jgi:hypothetical protein